MPTRSEEWRDMLLVINAFYCIFVVSEDAVEVLLLVIVKPMLLYAYNC